MGKEEMNQFLVRAFNTILIQEEKALSSSVEFGVLSVREFHVIEAAAAQESENTMGAIAKRLGITTGSLTVAVKTLEKKGYLLREKSQEDKRVVLVALTAQGLRANAYHCEFHNRMVEHVSSNLKEQELNSLVDTLASVTAFFEQG